MIETPDPIIRKSQAMRKSAWDALDRLAAHLGIVSSHGITAGAPSWRTLLLELSQWDTVSDEPLTPTPLDEFISEYFNLGEVIQP